jgi:AcrR family transcriptional regulator
MQDILEEARRQLARDGAAALSLRSVAREVGLVSSAVYRYVASRDELLTLLIIDAYSALADHVTTALADVRTRDGRTQWRTACRSLRAWARAHQHEYALLYGSPVPGYAAPQDTIAPATRLYAALLSTVADAHLAHHPMRLPRSVRSDAELVAATLELELAAPEVVTALGAIASLFGLLSFELFGHTTGVISDNDAYFLLQVDALATTVGL